MSMIGQVDLFGDVVTDKTPLSRDVLAGQLRATLGGYNLAEFVGLITNEFNEILQYAALTNGERACQKTSLLFNPHRLSTRTASSKHSIFDAIGYESFISGLARAVVWKNKKVGDLLYQVIQLGINGIQYANEFPPHVARDIYREYGISAEHKILDPCAGWGGRMIGASTVVDCYDCYEPSTQTLNGLKELSGFIKKLSGTFSANIYGVPFEDADLPSNYYDIALTSPPYYDTEIYSDELTNSLNRYTTFDDWVKGFYYPLISKTMDALKKGGVFVLNIGSRKYPLNELLLSGFSDKYEITRKHNYLSGIAGLGREGEGEMFYEIRKV